ncbi:MAG: adenine deaminase C-terminal domain-containing protein, partial [Candidatus Binatia bacterium]
MMRTKTELQRLVKGATGEIKADLIVTGGKLVNVYSGEILSGMEIAVIDGRICYVGPSAAHSRGDATEILDASGFYVSPGFIDAHTHIGHYCRPYEYLESYLPRGTTALVASSDELATVFGYAGVKLFLDEVEAHPLRVYSLIPMVAPQDPLLCSTRSLTDIEVAAGLDDPRTLGLGEIVSWLRLTQCDEEILERILMAHQRRKIIHGHTAGARDRALCAVGAVGISSCHEPIRVEDALERLRLGYWTMLREGSLRQDLEATLKPLLDRGVNLQRLILVTDSVAPDDAEDCGHMDQVLRRAVSMGLPPIDAIQTVTLNPATYSGLEQEIGGIGLGRFADLVLLKDLQSFYVEVTLIDGRVVAKKGVSLVNTKPIALPGEMMDSLQLSANVLPQELKIPCASSSAKIRVMEFVNQTITVERILNVSAATGCVEANSHDDLLKIAVFGRHGKKNEAALGFVKGFGAKVGAVGTTINLDENTLMVVGMNDEDMALCANTLIESGGGMIVINEGEVLDKMAFPYCGLFAIYPWQEVANG